MKLIVAVDEKWGIGKAGDLLLSIPDDMRYFREKTRNAMLIMGYNTLLSFPNSKPLPGRLNIVLADIKDLKTDRTITVNSLDELFRTILSLNTDELYVIGGGFTYRQLLPYCDTAYITKMQFSGDADTFIPDLDKDDSWHIENESDTYEHEGIKYSFVTYKNSSPVNIDFNEYKADLAVYFKKKDDIEVKVPDVDGISKKDEYISELKKLIIAYFRPLYNGVNFSELKDDLNSGDASLEKILMDKYLIADADSFTKLYDRYKDVLAGSKSVTVSKETLSSLDDIF